MKDGGLYSVIVMRKEAGETASFQRRVYWGEYL